MGLAVFVDETIWGQCTLGCRLGGTHTQGHVTLDDLKLAFNYR